MVPFGVAAAALGTVVRANECQQTKRLTMMTPEQVRDDIVKDIDGLLARPLVAWGRTRESLMAVRQQLLGATQSEIQRLASYVSGTYGSGTTSDPDA